MIPKERIVRYKSPDLPNDFDDVAFDQTVTLVVDKDGVRPREIAAGDVDPKLVGILSPLKYLNHLSLREMYKRPDVSFVVPE